MSSYILIERESARQIANIASWMLERLIDAGPDWQSHTRNLRIATQELDKSIVMSDAVTQGLKHTA